MVAMSLLLALAAAAIQPIGQDPNPRVPVAATGTASVRILTPALIGPTYGPPLPTMTAREATVPLPSGGTMPIRLYEFE